MAGEIGSGVNRILDELDYEMLNFYEEYAIAVVDPWLSFNGNPGQMKIVRTHILPVSQHHAREARPNWPESATPRHYMNALMRYKHPEVIQNAFSQTINDVYSTLYDLWFEATVKQEEHVLLVRGGDNAGPHSTWPVWRGSPTTIYSPA
jgi:hypothetical protein